MTNQIIEGEVDLEAKGRGWAREVDPSEPCPQCGYAQGAHITADLSCPDEAQASATWGR